MSLVADTITPRSTKGTSIKFTDSTTYLNATTKLSLDQGLVKGYCTEFDQANNATERTFNLSSVADVQTGVVDYFHANPFRAFRGYVQIPNVNNDDNIYGIIGIENHDSLTTECHSNVFAYVSASNWPLADGAHNSKFFGELA